MVFLCFQAPGFTKTTKLARWHIKVKQLPNDHFKIELLNITKTFWRRHCRPDDHGFSEHDCTLRRHIIVYTDSTATFYWFICFQLANHTSWSLSMKTCLTMVRSWRYSSFFSSVGNQGVTKLWLVNLILANYVLTFHSSYGLRSHNWIYYHIVLHM